MLGAGGLVALGVPVGPAQAITGENHFSTVHGTSSDPLTYLADHEYADRSGMIVWEGNVRVWQGDQALRADKIYYDRAAGELTALGHVALLQNDGTTLYAKRLQLAHGTADGIGAGIYIRMQDNIKLAAAGMRRDMGKLNSFGHAVYTACPTCTRGHRHPPFWEIQAETATQDHEDETIEFSNAWLKLLGFPVLYLPYFSVADPTVKRHSGFMNFNVNPHDRYLGTYFTLPYYWVIDDSSDLLITPLVASKTGPELSALYRKRFNFGYININTAVADDTHTSHPYTNEFGYTAKRIKPGAQMYFFGNGAFSIDKNWRANFNINYASSADYMRNYRVPGYGWDTLQSTAAIEGFGEGSYLRFDGQISQSLNNGVIRNKDLPYALPRFTYDFTSQVDPLGGYWTVHTTDFDVYRTRGLRDQRGELRLQWDRPFTNVLGQKWLLTGRLDSMIWHYSSLGKFPLYYNNTGNKHFAGQVEPTLALKMNWPFFRTFDHGRGSKVIEPILQLIAAPNLNYTGRHAMPNEDSFGYEFTDSTLFSLNRWLGSDRLDGGLRANVGYHENWTWRGKSIDLLVGESFQAHRQKGYLPFSGLSHHLSDPVGRIAFHPSRYVDFVGRARYSPWGEKNYNLNGQQTSSGVKGGHFNYGEAILNIGVPAFRLMGGYVYEPVTPFYYYYRDFRRSDYLNQPYTTRVSEITGGFSAKWDVWHISAYTRRSFSTHQFVSNGGEFGYNNDCYGMDIAYMKQYTYIGGQRRYSTVLFNFYFKTLGVYGTNG
ncbi:LPS-assembly protein LptD [Formicincola oecophyllae]|uniref:LPS-assembly protein LptD n=1 Tax=Formicincola oecophyllae TaxID=2558361 RepID=UPI001F10D569|nr:LPS assembly protein LptD [Formicincola oecophyllae]